jgi:predicted nuclease of restriction endonuclease-like (RecB) superfamily
MKTEARTFKELFAKVRKHPEYKKEGIVIEDELRNRDTLEQPSEYKNVDCETTYLNSEVWNEVARNLQKATLQCDEISKECMVKQEQLYDPMTI